MASKYSAMSDTKLYKLTLPQGVFVLVSDNNGESGMVYEMNAKLGPEPNDTPTYGQLDDGVVWRYGTILGPVTVDPEPLPDSSLRGYTDVKRDPNAIYRYFEEYN